MTGSNSSRRIGGNQISGGRLALVTLALVGAAGLALFAALGWAGSRPGSRIEVLGRVMDADTIQLGQELYAANCASCHGADLEGQPDWKERLPSGRMPAAPHDASGHTWHHSDQDFLLITREGLDAVVPGYESDMPAFGELLTEAETEAVLAFIKSTWPERERAYQAEATRNDS